MHTINAIHELRRQITNWKRNKQTVAFVPTMGNLHQGHLSLVEKARSICDKVVVSIYVNPTQFGANEDLGRYPRTLVADQQQLQAQATDLLFLPSDAVMYAGGTKSATRVIVPELSEILCGKSRPVHFPGVTTIVNKLFNIVQPDVAVFGEKDFQQLFIVKKMVVDLLMPVEIVSSPTVRERNGLAMSSRNQYLSDAQRQHAALLYKILRELREMALKNRDFRQLESIGEENLISSGFDVEYVSFRSMETLSPAAQSDDKVILLVAAWLGKTRLIDNLQLISRH